ncbi:hypothetical protein Dimus_039104 [Dionaea muscipula]
MRTSPTHTCMRVHVSDASPPCMANKDRSRLCARAGGREPARTPLNYQGRSWRPAKVSPTSMAGHKDRPTALRRVMETNPALWAPCMTMHGRARPVELPLRLGRSWRPAKGFNITKVGHGDRPRPLNSRWSV